MPADQIMREFYAGTLQSSSGARVTKLAQAKAIAASYSGRGEGHTTMQHKETKAVNEVLGGEKKRDDSKAKLHEVRVRRAHGGYVARHEEYRHKDGAHAPEHPLHASEHVLPDMDAVQAHMAAHMGEEQKEAAEGGEPDKE